MNNVPKIVSPAKQAPVNQKIPRVIYQTWKSDLVGDNMYKNVQNWIRLNPTYEYCFFDDQTIREYVYNFDCKEFDFTEQELQQAFDLIYPGAGRADIWRYCIIYAQGGVYADFDSVCEMPLDKFISPEVDCTTIINSWHYRAQHHPFSHWFLAYSKRNPIIKKTLELTVRSVLTRTPVDDFGTNITLLERYTGPAVYNKIFLKMLNIKPNYGNKIYTLANKKISIDYNGTPLTIKFLCYKPGKPGSETGYDNAIYLKFKYHSFIDDSLNVGQVYYPYVNVFNE